MAINPMPPMEDLDAMARLIADCNYDDLGPDQKARIVELTLQNNIDNSLAAIAYWFDNSKIYWP